jgi:predicted nucleic acid-binding protein
LIVVDASIVCDFLINPADYPEVVTLLSSNTIAAPSLLQYEIGHALRRLNLIGILTDEQAAQTLDAFMQMQIDTHANVALMPRTWALRHNMTFYDASYVALAESLGVPLFTKDKRLAAAPGHSAEIICL